MVATSHRSLSAAAENAERSSARDEAGHRQKGRIVKMKPLLLSIGAAVVVIVMLVATLKLETRSTRTSEQQGVAG